MLSRCQCTANPSGEAISDQAVACLSDAALASQDRTGQSGYRLLTRFSPEDSEKILTQLPDEDYSRRIREFANMVELQAGLFRDRYLGGHYTTDFHRRSRKNNEWYSTRMARRFEHFKRHELPRLFPEFKKLPLRYEPLEPTTYAVYSYADDTISVGNLFVDDIIRKRWRDVRCTIGHEKVHRDSRQTGRELRKALFEEAMKRTRALTASAQYFLPFGPFNDAMENEWWYDSEGSYVNPEGEAVARLYEIRCYRSTTGKARSDSLQDASDRLEFYIQQILHDHHPYIAAGILKNIEGIAGKDLPGSLPILSAYLYSGGQDWGAVIHGYNTRQQLCDSAFPRRCEVGTDAAPVLAKPAEH